MPGEEYMKQMLEEPLDSVITIRLGVSARGALREIAAWHGASEQDLIRRLVAMLATSFNDMRDQVSLGASFGELLARSTRLTVSQMMNMSPMDLRQAADEFKQAAYALADLIEGQGRLGKKEEGT